MGATGDGGKNWDIMSDADCDCQAVFLIVLLGRCLNRFQINIGGIQLYTG